MTSACKWGADGRFSCVGAPSYDMNVLVTDDGSSQVLVSKQVTGATGAGTTLLSVRAGVSFIGKRRPATVAITDLTGYVNNDDKPALKLVARLDGDTGGATPIQFSRNVAMGNLYGRTAVVRVEDWKGLMLYLQ